MEMENVEAKLEGGVTKTQKMFIDSYVVKKW